MKKLIIIVSVLLSTNLMACPNLEGDYYCINDRAEVFDLNIVQTVKNGFDKYKVSYKENTFKYLADNLKKPFKNDDMVIAWYTVSCKQDTLLKSIGNIFKNYIEYSIDSNGLLNIKRSTNIVGSKENLIKCRKS